MKRQLILIFLAIISLSGCASHLGGGHSKNDPMLMKYELNPEELALVNQAFDIGSPVVDHHLHVIGETKISSVMQEVCPSYAETAKQNNGGKDIETSAWINEERFSPSTLKQIGLWFKTKVLMNTMRIKNRETADVESTNRLLRLVKGMINKTPTTSGYDIKINLLAMDGYYEKGAYSYDEKYTDMYIPNDYVVHLSGCLNSKIEASDPFVPVISINPYRVDALDELEKYKDKAQYIKWLPPAMGFDPLDPYIDPFLKKVAKYNMVIISHSGGEHAFDVKDESFRKYGDPLRLVKALDMGVTVIISHAGGDDDDGRYRNRDNFNEMIQDDRNDEKWCLFGDTSALTLPKNIPHFDEFLEAETPNIYKYRMLYGSDYPLPAVWNLNPLEDLIPSDDLIAEDGAFQFSLNDRSKDRYIDKKLIVDDLIIEDSKKALLNIFSYNPLVFDVVVKRNLHPKGIGGSGLPKEMFMSMEENIRREQADTSENVKKREQCLTWYNRANNKKSN